MAIAYSASTLGATFLLDEAGVCRRVLLKRAWVSQQTLAGRTRAQAARRVVGAQYVASIDTRVEGGLTPMPRKGAAMLFAFSGEDGRLAVVRTAPLVHFETMAAPDDTVPVPDLDDECLTIPLTPAMARSLAATRADALTQSGERRTPTWLFDNDDDIHDLDDSEATLPPVLLPSPSPAAPRAWPTLPASHDVRLRRVSLVDADEAAPTQRHDRRPAGRGMLPKRATRG